MSDIPYGASKQETSEDIDISLSQNTNKDYTTYGCFQK